MLTITVPGGEWYDESREEYVYTKPQTLQLEHSLVSLSKWESKWKKPFLNNKKQPEPRSLEESIDYIRCMTITQNVDPMVYTTLGFNPNVIDQVNEYINDSHTATWFGKKEGEGPSISREAVTSELIYYWMISLQIPFECQKWHLNRLLTLIKVCNIKNQPPQKMSKRQLAASRTQLNAQRLARTNGRG